MSQQGFETGTNYVAPQPHPTTVPMIQSGEGGISAVDVNEQSRRGKYLKKMRSLGIAEVVLGVLAVIVVVISAALFFLGITEITRSIFGIMIIVSGSLGIGTGKPNPSNCMINTRMAFAIIGSVFAASGFSNSITLALLSVGFGSALSIVSALIFLVSFVLMIVSSGYCCAINGCCCNPHSAANVPGSHPVQVVYTHQETSYPVTQSVYPGYVDQGYQPMQQMQPANPSINQSGVVPPVYPTLDPTFQATPASQQKQQESLSEEKTANVSDPPPSYQPN